MTATPEVIENVYRAEASRVLATLIRWFHDFDTAEEALHEAFAAAVEQWPRSGVPENPRAWLVSAARFKAVDAIRKRARLDASLATLAREAEAQSLQELSHDVEGVRDDQLRLIFTCCHPALGVDTQIALTLREVAGLTTEEVASAFLTAPATIAQRIVRGKAKIRHAKIPYEVPSLADLPVRLDAVLSVLYLVFNEGYSATRGSVATRANLSDEAIRLTRVLLGLLEDPEIRGLLGLMLLHNSRRDARVTAAGDLILLEDQDRSTWDRQQIVEGEQLVEQALASGRFGFYTLQAAIAAVHALSPSTSQTDWAQIVALYDVLLRIVSSPVVELNRAAAVAMRDGPAAGLALIEAILTRGQLADYHLAHAAQADLLRRLGQIPAARKAYEKALELAKQEPERRFLSQRIQELS